MKVKYDGKSPGKLWYFLQNARALTALPLRSATRPVVKSAVVHAGLFLGSLLAMKTVLLPMMTFPLIGSAGVLVGAGACILFGFTSYRKIRGLKTDPAVVKSVQEHEQKWLDKKMHPKGLKRLLHREHDGERVPKKRKEIEAAAAAFRQAAKPVLTPEMTEARRHSAEERANARKRARGSAGLGR